MTLDDRNVNVRISKLGHSDDDVRRPKCERPNFKLGRSDDADSQRLMTILSLLDARHHDLTCRPLAYHYRCG